MAVAAGHTAQARLTSRLPAWIGIAADAVAADIALRHLDAVARARRRLKRDTDPEALHDFRVASRRLRSILRAYRPWLDSVPKKLRRQLREVARATSVGRDAEVCLVWLEQRHDAVAGAGYDRLRAQLERSRDDAYAHVREDVLAASADVEQRLRRRLKDIRRNGRDRPGTKTSYAVATSERLHRYIARVAADLARIGGVSDTVAIHDARIQAKRLRYLLEPLADADVSAARAAVTGLRVFQDQTGLLCDGLVRRALLVLAGKTAPDVGGALTRRNEADIRRRFEAVRRRYLARGMPRFLGQAGVVVRQLSTGR